MSKQWKPKKANIPSGYWQAEAEAFLAKSKYVLQSSRGIEERRWLNSRGLSDRTIKRAGLGLNLTNKFETKKKWGIYNSKSSENVWLPTGIVIPYYHQDQLIRLRIWMKKRNSIVSGSSSLPMFWDMKMKVSIVVENELDGMLIWQEARDLVNIIALGSVIIKPDITIHNILCNSSLFLISLDSDKVGIKAIRKWWLKNYPKAKRWPLPLGKALSEVYQKNLNIRAWIQDGLI